MSEWTKGCPFCGGASALSYGANKKWAGNCRYCTFRGPEFDEKEKALAAWNKRATFLPTKEAS